MPSAMLIRNNTPNDFFEQQLLASLRETAADLPRSNVSAVWQLGILARRCSRELGLSLGSLKFLLGLGTLRHYNEVKRTKADWDTRLGRLRRPSPARPRIVLVVSEGQAVRSFLLTDVCKKIVGWAELYVLSPLDVEEDVAALGPHAHFLPVPMVRRNYFDLLVSYLGYRQTESPTAIRFVQRLDEMLEKATRKGERAQGRLRIWQLAKNFPSNEDYLRVYCWSLRLFSQFYSLNEFVNLLRRIAPDLVFNTSLVSQPARLWTRAAALAGIPVLSNVISWDNMSTKTLFDEFVDTVLVWSEEMDADLATSVPFLRDKPRVIVGSPQFEPIVGRRDLVSRPEFLGRYGLDPDKKLILYTTGTTSLFPNEPKCLDRVLDHWRDNLSDRTGLMVRMHPKDRQGRYEAAIKKFPEVPFTLAGHNLAFNNEWVPTRDDIALLVNQLHHCDLIVNIASTMTLEGFVVDKPAVNIGFDLGVALRRNTIADMYVSRHYGDIITSGAARLAGDYDELFAAIDDILDRNMYDVDKQRRILAKKCKHVADASDRINEFLRGCAVGPAARRLSAAEAIAR